MDCRWMFFVVLLFCGSCGQGVQQALDAPCNIRSGELLLTEWYANAEQTDQQWLELKNTSSRPLSLHRLLMRFSPYDDAVVVNGTQPLLPGQLALVGVTAVSVYDYPVDKLPLHRAKEVSLSCDGKNFLTWRLPQQKVIAGSSIGISPFALNDPQLYASEISWCATQTVLQGETGTPGRENPVCGTLQCLDDNDWLTVTSPVPSSIRLNEVMNNPSGDDTNAEWLELHSVADQPVLLNGLHISSEDQNWQLMSSRCLWLKSGNYAVLGVKSDTNALLPIQPDHWLYGPAIKNAALDFNLSLRGVAQDKLQLPSVTQNGISQGRDGLDDSPQVCAMQSNSAHFAGSEVATPGALNDACSTACVDGQGSWQRLRPAMPGELLLSEVMSNPEGNDQGREWLEVFLNASEPRYANELELVQKNMASGNERHWRFSSRVCVSLPPRQHVVIAQDGSLPGLGARVLSLPELQLYNDASEMELWQADQLLDRALLPVSSSGSSLGVDFQNYDSTENDQPDSFCVARRSSVQGNSSPGEKNDACGDYCWTGSEWRELRKPLPEQLLINEVLTNPEGVDAGRDWLQLQASESVDLNDVQLSQSLISGNERQWRLSAADCLSLESGKSLILAGEGIAPLTHPYIFLTVPGLDMYSSDDGMLMLQHGEQWIDSAFVAKGVSGLAQRLRDPLADNALPASWCQVEDKLQSPLMAENVSDAPGC